MTETIPPSNKREIIYNLINAGLAGALVLLGSLSNGKITWEGFIFAAIASGVVIITKFKDYWETEKGEYCTNLINFI